MASGRFLCKADGVVCGLWVCELVFSQLSPDIRFQPLVEEASPVTRGQDLAVVTGPARAILAGERVALNFLQRLSGIATMARQAASAVEGTKTRVLDTRKTTPGLRILEKWAVRAGGASNHRFGLFDMVLIKDNHILLAGGIGAAIAAARRNTSPMVKIEVECADLKQVREALKAGADVIMLDNMDVTAMSRAVALINGRALVEASGGITVSALPEVAKTGVDFASMGALTHSYRSLDISLELQPLGATPPARG
ncbi:MAG: nicotinate-nucleotide diphosphorylase (carboxylating) [Firmicutes bacterium RBG_13_65_8]|nr:MAG: nicotinate-nucleotide diphosphorylase (carboxylating) [Firmicutes bacterium RBG_13_65_8]